MSEDIKIPPHNTEAEKSLLGCLLIDSQAFVKIGDMVNAEDFYHKPHSIVFATVCELFNKHQPIDVLSVANRLQETENLEKVGGKAQIIELANLVTTSSHITHYATIIRKKATLRQLLEAANEIAQESFNESEEVDAILDKSEQALFRVSNRMQSKPFVAVSNVLTEAFERIDELHREKGKLRGLTTGFTSLDSMLGGLQKDDLVILAARPSVGKTALALDIARQAALKSKLPVGIFSLEMSKEQLVDRMICAEANVDLWKMRTGRLSEQGEVDDFSRIGHALGSLSEAPLFIDDDPLTFVTKIRTKARRLKQEHGLGMIVVDYLQLIVSKTKIENRVQEISMISRSLKTIARELNIPVLALSQLSRSVEQSKPAIPKLSHLRDSGSIEQDADVVMFLYRKASDRNYRFEDIPPEERNLCEVHIAKHRNGPTGMVKLYFDAARVTFKNLEKTFSRPQQTQQRQKQTVEAGQYPKQAIKSHHKAPQAPPIPPM